MNIIYCHCDCEVKPKQEAISELGLLQTLRVLAMTVLFVVCSLLVLSEVEGWTVDSYADPVSSTDLINNAKEYDGKAVTYQGEVIGDVMIRGEYAWVNVKNGGTAVGIWMAKDLAESITHKGAYNEQGDLIEVEGVFNRSCKQHGGDLDIHAESMIRVKDGYAVKYPLDKIKARYAIFFGIILIFVSLWKFYKKFVAIV